MALHSIPKEISLFVHFLMNKIYKEAGVIIVPTQTLYYYERNPSNLP